MKLSIVKPIVICALLIVVIAGHSQQLPNAPYLSKVDYALTGTETMFRTTDMVTTHINSTNKCKCFDEGDPIAPSGTN